MYTGRIRVIMLALLAAFAFSAVVAAAAQAEEAPFWSTEGKRLAMGETHYYIAKSYNEFAISSPTLGITVKCEATKIKEGVHLGSNASEPGMGSGVIEFEKNCRQTGNGEACKVKEPIITRLLRLELVLDVTKKKLFLEIRPSSGGRIAAIEFTGTCKAKEIAVEGSVAGEDRSDPNKPPEIGENIELPNTEKQAKSWLVNFPRTPIQKIWLIRGGVGTEVSVGLLVATEPATLEGTILVNLAKKTSGVLESEEVNWGPLP